MSELVHTIKNPLSKFLAVSVLAHTLLFTMGTSNSLNLNDSLFSLPSPSSKLQLKMRPKTSETQQVVKAQSVIKKKKTIARKVKKPKKKLSTTKKKSEAFNNILTKTQKFEKYIKSFNSPKYSRLAQRRGIQGTVVLGIVLDELGNVKKVNLKKSAGHGILDKSAIEAAKSWSFNKLPYSGIEVEKKIVFKLR